MIVCSDKVNQMRHLGFLQNKADVLKHMSKHADLVKPKFEVVFSALDSLDSKIGSYKKPTGGYFYFI
jgi:DNA-binding transcriptional MocR family regulator